MPKPKSDPKNLPARLDSIAPLGKIIELRNKKLSYEEIGAICGVSKQAIHERLSAYKQSIDELQAVKDNRADVLAVVGDSLINSLTYKDVQKMSGLQRITGFGILYDKERLERDKSSVNVAYADYSRSMQEIDKQITQLEEELGEAEAED